MKNLKMVLDILVLEIVSLSYAFAGGSGEGSGGGGGSGEGSGGDGAGGAARSVMDLFANDPKPFLFFAAVVFAVILVNRSRRVNN